MNTIANWYCPSCRKEVSSVELNESHRHSCGAVAEWRRVRILSLDEQMKLTSK